jgi:hypothetical protein
MLFTFTIDEALSRSSVFRFFDHTVQDFEKRNHLVPGHLERSAAVYQIKT